MIEIIGFGLTTSLHKFNFHANHTHHAHHAHHAQNWSVEPLSDFHLDPPLKYCLLMCAYVLVCLLFCVAHTPRKRNLLQVNNDFYYKSTKLITSQVNNVGRTEEAITPAPSVQQMPLHILTSKYKQIQTHTCKQTDTNKQVQTPNVYTPHYGSQNVNYGIGPESMPPVESKKEQR